MVRLYKCVVCREPERADWKTCKVVRGCGFVPFCSDECTHTYYDRLEAMINERRSNHANN